MAVVRNPVFALGRVYRPGDEVDDGAAVVVRYPELFDDVGRILDPPKSTRKKSATKKAAAKTED
mgnify:CR=1 FL=1